MSVNEAESGEEERSVREGEGEGRKRPASAAEWRGAAVAEC